MRTWRRAIEARQATNATLLGLGGGAVRKGKGAVLEPPKIQYEAARSGRCFNCAAGCNKANLPKIERSPAPSPWLAVELLIAGLAARTSLLRTARQIDAEHPHQLVELLLERATIRQPECGVGSTHHWDERSGRQTQHSRALLPPPLPPLLLSHRLVELPEASLKP